MLLYARRDDVERIGDLASLGHRHLEAAPVRAGEVQHTPVDALAPRLGLRQQPTDRSFGVATRDNGEQLAPRHVHDRGAPPAGPQTPWRPNRVSSRPRASTAPTRSQSVASSALPQESTARFTACQSQPNSAATSATGRASRPTCKVAQRPARDVSADRAGAIRSSISVNEATPQLAAGQHHRHLCHTRRTGRPNAAKSTKLTGAEPLKRIAPLSPHTPAGAGSEREPPAAQPARRRRRGPPPRRDRRSTHRYA